MIELSFSTSFTAIHEGQVIHPYILNAESYELWKKYSKLINTNMNNGDIYHDDYQGTITGRNQIQSKYS